jgi:hypothetical protein
MTQTRRLPGNPVLRLRRSRTRSRVVTLDRLDGLSDAGGLHTCGSGRAARTRPHPVSRWVRRRSFTRELCGPRSNGQQRQFRAHA